VFGFTRNQCSASIGIDVRLAPEWAFGFNRNECSTSAGLCMGLATACYLALGDIYDRFFGATETFPP